MKKVEDQHLALTKQYQKDLEEKEATWGNDLHRMTREKDDKARLLQVKTHELEATREALQSVQLQFQSAQANIQSLRKEIDKADSELKTAGKAAQQTIASASEIARLKDELRRNTDAYQCQDQKLDTLRQDYASLQSENAALRRSDERHQSQISEYQSTLQKAHKESEISLEEQRKKDQAALKEACNQVVLLQAQNKDLESSFQQYQNCNSTALKDAKSRFAMDKQDLHAEVAELQSANKALEHEIEHTRTNAAQDLERAALEYSVEVDNSRRQLQQALEALKESEAKCKRVECEKTHELQAHARVTELKMKEKFDEQNRAFHALVEQQANEKAANMYRQMSQKGAPVSSQHTIAHRTPHASTAQLPSSIMSSSPSASQPKNHAKPKKKVNRQSNSVVIAEVSSQGHSKVISSRAEATTDEPSRGPTLSHPNHYSEPLDAFALDPVEQLDENSLSLHDPPAELVPETQEEEFGFDPFIDLRSQASTSTSQLSDWDPKVIEMLEYEPPRTPLGAMRAATGSPLKDCVANNVDSPSRITGKTSQGSGASGRPMSRANTASRMAPPAAYILGDRASQLRKTPSNSASSHQPMSQRSRNTQTTRTSSPDYLQKSSSSATKKHTYGHNSVKDTSSQATRIGTIPAAAHEGQTHKRKTSISRTDPSACKRHRSSSQSPPLSQGYQANPTSSNRVHYQSQSQVRSSQSTVPGSSSRTGSRRSKSKSAPFI